MERKIALFAREFLSGGTEYDRKTDKYVEVPRRLHQEVARELATYGKVISQRTSGVMMRVDTPSHGIRRDELSADAQVHETVCAFNRALRQIDEADFIVFVRDSFNDTRGALVHYAYQRRKHILALRQVQPIIQTIEAIYHLPGIMNIEFTVKEDRQSGHALDHNSKVEIRRYFNSFPQASAAG